MRARSRPRVGTDLGIDLGTTWTRVAIPERGVVLEEPSVVAVDTRTLMMRGAGRQAKLALGRAPGGTVAIRPVRASVLADFSAAERMLSHFLRAACGRRLLRPRVVAAVPVRASAVERRAVIDALMLAGASAVRLVEQPMAAAIGAGLPVEEPLGSMIVDVGGGTTEVAVVAFGGVVSGTSLTVAGDAMDEVIVQHLRRAHGLAIGEQTAEEIKCRLGAVSPDDRQGDEEMMVRGRDVTTGLPKSVRVRSSEVCAALAEPLQRISTAVRSVLTETPPELVGDVLERGILLVGGGSLLPGLDRFLAEQIGVPVRRAAAPLTAVALGTSALLEHFDTRHPFLSPIA